MAILTRRGFLWQAGAALGAAQSRYNVLLLAIDDLRPALGCYADPFAQTPQIDRLARAGLVFTHAYCQQPLCTPSRASLLTGLRPDTTRIFSNDNRGVKFREALPDAVTLPEHFRQNGYVTESIGKIFHGSTLMVDERSWSSPERFFVETVREHYALEKNRVPKGSRDVKTVATEAADVPDEVYLDGKVAKDAVETLRRLREKPFFLGVGFRKPHLPFAAPQRYWNLYDRRRVPLAPHPSHPKDMPAIALRAQELRSYPDIPDEGPIPEEKMREAVHGYYAATSFSDANVGKVLDELDRLKLRQKTIIVLFGDHGWHLGDHDYWGKSTNFEVSARAPLIVSVPGMRAVGRLTRALVELVDIYPTLLDLCGMPARRELEGASFRPLLDQPDRAWKAAAFTQNPRGGRKPITGYSLRTERYRYTEWTDKDGEVYGVELYDYQTDPLETENHAGKPGNRELVARLRKQLRAGWRAAIPRQ